MDTSGGGFWSTRQRTNRDVSLQHGFRMLEALQTRFLQARHEMVVDLVPAEFFLE